MHKYEPLDHFVYQRQLVLFWLGWMFWEVSLALSMFKSYMYRNLEAGETESLNS